MKNALIILLALVSIALAQDDGYEGGDDEDGAGYGDGASDQGGYAGGFNGEGAYGIPQQAYGALPQQAYGGVNLAQLMGAYGGAAAQGDDAAGYGGYGGLPAGYGQAAGMGEAAGYGDGAEDSGYGGQQTGGLEDAASLYAQAAAGAGGEGLAALAGALG